MNTVKGTTVLEVCIFAVSAVTLLLTGWCGKEERAPEQTQPRKQSGASQPGTDKEAIPTHTGSSEAGDQFPGTWTGVLTGSITWRKAPDPTIKMTVTLNRDGTGTIMFSNPSNVPYWNGGLLATGTARYRKPEKLADVTFEKSSISFKCKKLQFKGTLTDTEDGYRIDGTAGIGDTFWLVRKKK